MLTDLLLAGNPINKIPTGAFSNLPKLPALDLSYCQITNIQPAAFSNLPKLTGVLLLKNRIENIQTGTFSNLPWLRKLWLDHNQITIIQPGAFSNLPTLASIHVRFSRINNIQPGTFLNLLKLKELWLSDNQITDLRTTFQPGAFSNLPKLIALYLDRNQISSIRPGTFSNLTNTSPYLPLTYLNFNRNKITEIHPRAFSDLPRLKMLFLESNRISVLPMSVYGLLASIFQVKIENNPFQCDCNMAPFRLNMTGSHSFEDQIVCSQPGKLKGRKLKDINPGQLTCKVLTTTTVMPASGQLPHTSHYHWHFKQNANSTACPVGPTFTTRKSENNTSHESDPSFPKTALIASSVCGPIVGIVLIGTIFLTIWYKRRAKIPPLGQPNVVSNDRSLQVKKKLVALESNNVYEDIDAENLPPKHEDAVRLRGKHIEDPNVPKTEGLSYTNTTVATVHVVASDYEYENLNTQTEQGQYSKTNTNTNTTAALVASGYDQTGQGKFQTLAGELYTNTTASAALKTNVNYQLEQGQSRAINQPNTNTTATVTTSDQDHHYEDMNQHNHTRQGQSQAITGSNANTTAVVVANCGHEYEDIDTKHDQTAQGHSQTTTNDKSLLAARNLIYTTEEPASESNPV
ncbi:uncharacterized protein LOC144916354 [Branchiostoma floridae x Branchiostoma belcheri]